MITFREFMNNARFTLSPNMNSSMVARIHEAERNHKLREFATWV